VGGAGHHPAPFTCGVLILHCHHLTRHESDRARKGRPRGRSLRCVSDAVNCATRLLGGAVCGGQGLWSPRHAGALLFVAASLHRGPRDRGVNRVRVWIPILIVLARPPAGPSGSSIGARPAKSAFQFIGPSVAPAAAATSHIQRAVTPSSASTTSFMPSAGSQLRIGIGHCESCDQAGARETDNAHCQLKGPARRTAWPDTLLWQTNQGVSGRLRVAAWLSRN